MRFHKESGSATILAFGLTIMIMSLAIGFLSTSLVGKKASSNHMEVVVARMSAQNALSRAIAAVRCAQDHTLSYNELFSMSEKPMSDTEKEDLKTLLPTTYNKIVYISDDTVANMVESSETDSDLSWIYQSSNIGPSDKNISRMAYAIIGQPEYTPDTPKYPDAFYYNNPDDIDYNPENDTPKITNYSKHLYQRFNLARGDWSSITVENFLENDIPWSNGPPVSNTIKYLREFNDGPGTFTDIETRRKQIIANLIDFCDTDTAATTDNENAPTYTGNDKTPYINEVRITFEGMVYSVNVLGNSSSWYWFRRRVDVELVNMYDIKYENLNAEVSFSYSYKIADQPLTTETIQQLVEVNKTEPKSYGHGTGLFTLEDDLYPPLGITVGSISNIRVKLIDKNTGAFYDFSNLKAPSIEEELELIAPGDEKVFKFLSFDYEVNDPRHNLNESDWTDSIGIGTIGWKNTTFPEHFWGGTEDTKDWSDTDRELDGIAPWEISTAEIKNAPMEEICELGYIHRGAAWQTLNLKSFNTGETGTDSAYAEGDAAILNHVKIDYDIDDDDNERIIAANLNSRDRESLTDLFTIETVSEPDSIFTLTDTMLEQFPKVLFPSRAEIMENPEISKYLTNNMFEGQSESDIDMELFTGALNYAEALPYEKFYVIAIGQAIREIDGHKDAIPKEYDKTDQILSTQKMIAEVIKDPGDANNPYKIIRIRYLEE